MLKCRVMRSTRSRSRPRGPAQTGTVGPFVLSKLGKNHKDCAHQSGYYWADDIQKVQTHLCDEVDKMSDGASGLKAWRWHGLPCSLGASTPAPGRVALADAVL